MLHSCLHPHPPGTAAPPGKESADARQAKRLLASRHWVPSLGSAGGAADAGSSSDGADASAEDPTQQAREIEAALEQHGCGVSLADVRLWALLLWLELGGIACLEGNPQAPSERRLLVGCQLALSSGQLSEFEAARVLHIAAKAATGNELQASAAASQRGAQLVQLLEEGMQRADAARVYKEASALARNLLPLLLLRAQAQGGSERAATFSRADQLSAQLDAWRQLYKRWLPSASTRQLAFVDGQVQASARDLKRQLRTGRLEGGCPRRLRLHACPAAAACSSRSA